MERWEMFDPALVLERKQERGWRQPETKEERAQKAREQLEALFEERGTDEAEHRNLAE